MARNFADDVISTPARVLSKHKQIPKTNMEADARDHILFGFDR